MRQDALSIYTVVWIHAHSNFPKGVLSLNGLDYFWLLYTCTCTCASHCGHSVIIVIVSVLQSGYSPLFIVQMTDNIDSWLHCISWISSLTCVNYSVLCRQLTVTGDSCTNHELSETSASIIAVHTCTYICWWDRKLTTLMWPVGLLLEWVYITLF